MAKISFTRMSIFVFVNIFIICVNHVNIAEALLTGRNPGNIADAHLTFTGFCHKFGYPVEAHSVQTQDGYLLTTFRIPYGKKSPLTNTPKRVVLLQHGFLSSSDSFVINTPEKDLAYLLADAGYDVWVNNARGVPYSQTHVTLNKTDREFWKFSFHEMGVYDIPALIHYILGRTGEETLSYVGHSMGTTMFWIAMSTFPELNSKIRVMIALAPIAYISHATAPIFRFLSPALPHVPTSLFVRMLSIDGVTYGEFSPRRRVSKLFSNLGCQASEIVEEAMCDSVYFLFFGFDRFQANQTQRPVYFSHFPTSTSVYTLMHYGQMVNSRRFCQYDHGVVENYKRYGQKIPPEYDLTKVTAKVALFWALNDWLSDPEDVVLLAKKLPNVIDIHRVQHLKFNHADYMTAIDIVPLLLDPLMKILQEN